MFYFIVFFYFEVVPKVVNKIKIAGIFTLIKAPPLFPEKVIKSNRNITAVNGKILISLSISSTGSIAMSVRDECCRIPSNLK